MKKLARPPLYWQFKIITTHRNMVTELEKSVIQCQSQMNVWEFVRKLLLVFNTVNWKEDKQMRKLLLKRWPIFEVSDETSLKMNFLKVRTIFLLSLGLGWPRWKVEEVGHQQQHQDPWDIYSMSKFWAARFNLNALQWARVIGRPIKGGQFRLVNFASQFICVQIFQIDFPLILSVSKYFRWISLSFSICRGQNKHFSMNYVRKHRKNCECCPVSLLIPR